MANYYYFASDEEYKYALEHGWIKDTANKVKGFVKTTASKIALNKKRKQIEKTPVKTGVDISEARHEQYMRRRNNQASENAKEISKRQNRMEAIQKKVSPESNAKRKTYASKSIRTSERLNSNKRTSEIRRKNRGITFESGLNQGINEINQLSKVFPDATANEKRYLRWAYVSGDVASASNSFKGKGGYTVSDLNNALNNFRDMTSEERAAIMAKVDKDGY